MSSRQRSIFKSFQRRIRKKTWLLSQYRASRKYQDRYANDCEQIQSFCLFIGYPRSGSSLTGALVDAHSDVVMAHELDVLKCVRYGFSIQQIYWSLIEKSKYFHQVKGNQYSKYSYAVPNQWQGRYRSLRVIGDKFGDRTVEVMARYPRAMAKLERSLNVPLKFIHVIRNPYDNISTIYRKHFGRDDGMQSSIDWYFQLAQLCDDIRKKHGPDHVYDAHLERLIADPGASMKKLMTWLSVEPDEPYLNDCASIVFDKARKTQEGLPWTPSLVDQVHERMQAYDFFREMNYQADIALHE